jgi:aldose sugar dehydrogenase
VNIQSSLGIALLVSGLLMTMPYVSAELIEGTSEGDNLKGTSAADIIIGHGGSDVLDGLDGNDEIAGNDGDEDLLGSEGNDYLTGNGGNDDLRGGEGNDRIEGGKDDDQLFGTEGDDILSGGPGDDTLRGEDGNDILSAGQGNDTLVGGPGNNTLTGGPGADNFDCGLEVDKVLDFNAPEGDIVSPSCLAEPGSKKVIRPQTEPTISNDTALMVETIVTGLNSPTNMAFLGPNDILVLEKDKGTVQRIINGNRLPEPLIDVDVVANDGLTGIAVSKNGSGSTYVFLYFTESSTKGDASSTEYAEEGKKNDPIGNRLYRYELRNDALVNPKLLLNLPAIPGPIHHGGEIVIGPDNILYVTLGDIEGSSENYSSTKAQNYKDGPDPDGRSAILRITQNGQLVNGTGILGDEHPLDMYYAYGIRNSFGMDFDPITGKLWDTENGPDYGDEINLVEPGFNSGWRVVQGLWKPERGLAGHIALNPDDLVDFDGKGKYSAPEFIWYYAVAPTALKFFNSDKLGKQYSNDMFVGDINNGRLYHFGLNEERTELALNSPLADKIANSTDELQDIIFGQGFGGITDIQVGPDGYLYVVSLRHGAIYRIVPHNSDLLP